MDILDRFLLSTCDSYLKLNILCSLPKFVFKEGVLIFIWIIFISCKGDLTINIIFNNKDKVLLYINLILLFIVLITILYLNCDLKQLNIKAVFSLLLFIDTLFINNLFLIKNILYIFILIHNFLVIGCHDNTLLTLKMNCLLLNRLSIDT